MESPSETDEVDCTIREQASRMLERLRFTRNHFPVAVDDWTQYWPHTNREQCMVVFMEEATIEENWTAKVFDEVFIQGWKADVMGRDWQ